MVARKDEPGWYTHHTSYERLNSASQSVVNKLGAMATSRLKIGVLLVPPVQLLDLAAVDLFHMLSKQYLRECQLPQSVVDIAIDEVHIRYISESGPSQIGTISVVPLTASCFVQVTDHLDSPKVAAGSLDILFVPGPDPSLVPSEPVRQFVRKHAEHEHTTVISVCTGIYVLGYAGVLDGQTVSGPRALVDMDLKKKFPKARWGDRRWEIGGDGRLWTSGQFFAFLSLQLPRLTVRD